MKKVNDFYTDTAPADAKMKNDVSSDTSIGGSTSVIGDVNKNMPGEDIGVGIKGLVVNKGKGKKVNFP